MKLGVILLGLLLLAPTTPAAGALGAAATCGGLPATLVGTADEDYLVGTPGNDVIVGLGGDDRIQGGEGDDVLCGRAGGDEMDGGAGDDRLYGGTNGWQQIDEGVRATVADALAPGPGDDLVDLGTNLVQDQRGYAPDTIDLSDAAAGVTVDLTAGTAVGDGNDILVVPIPVQGYNYAAHVIGSRFADVLLGCRRFDWLSGNGGGDRLFGGEGSDILEGFWADEDVVSDDVLDGGPGWDDLDAGYGDDVLAGGPGGDRLQDYGVVAAAGGAGRDVLALALLPGRHTVIGGDGKDRLNLGLVTGGGGGPRADAVLDLGLRVLRADARNDRRWRAFVDPVERVDLDAASHWVFRGSSDRDRVRGNRAYVASGRGGDDVLIGSRQGDVLLGGSGRDRILGLGGVDRCRAERTRGCER